MDGDTLYAADTAMDRVHVFDLESTGGDVSASLSGTLSSDLVGSPTFLEVGGMDRLYVLNTVDDFALVSIDPRDIQPAPVDTVSPTTSPVALVDIPMFETIDVASTTVSLGPAHPGGIALGSGALGNQLFVSNLFFGGIRVIDLTSGESRVLQGNRLYLERTAFGMDFDEENELLFVTGSETLEGGVNSGLLYAYDPFTGEEALMCRVPDYYPTDVAVVGSQVYTTNTLTNTLVVAASPASGDCELDQIQLPDEFAAAEFDASVVQGVTPYTDGLILVSLGDDQLYYYDPAAGSYTAIATGPTRGGGLHVEDDHLFVADTANDRVLVYELAGGTGEPVTATAVGALQSEFLEGPTFLDVFNGNLYTPNSLFSTDEPTEDYSLVVQNVVSILPFEFPTVVSLQEFQPGGIEVGAGFFQDQLFISNLLFGGVLVVDVITGDRRVLLGNLLSTGRTAFGLACDKESNHLFVAGSESGQGAIFVVDIMTGGQVATCEAPNFYPTDVAIMGNSAYATNSLEASVVVLDIAAAVEGRCEVEVLDLPAEVAPPEDFDPATLYSLATYNEGVMMASKEPGVPSTIYYVDLATGSTTELAPGPVGGVGGIEVNRNQLIVSDAGANTLEVYNLELDGEAIAASPSSTIESDQFAGPLASAVYKDSVVYSINSQPVNGAYQIVASDL